MDCNKKDTVIELKSLTTGYRKAGTLYPLVGPVNISAQSGEFIAIIGRNGIGKSTLLKTIAGLLKPLEGDVIIKRKKITEYRRNELAVTTAYVSTEQIRADSMKVGELVELGRYPYASWTGRLSETDQDKIFFAMEKTGILDLRDRFISELSDGERQKAMIARVIAQDTDILIMDEPVAFLDIKNKYEIMHLLRSLSDEQNKTIIFSGHDLTLIMDQCDRIWLIADRTIYDGAPEDLVLNGLMNKLFDDSSFKFSERDATFSTRREYLADIKINGEGIYKFWTIKALNRGGFRAVSHETTDSVTVDKDADGFYWIYKSKIVESPKLRTIHALLQWIRRVPEND